MLASTIGRLLTGSAAALMAVSCAPAQTVFSPGDPQFDRMTSVSAAPQADGTRIPTTWVEELHSGRGVHLFARNDRSYPVRVTKVAISICNNIRGGCVEWDPGIVLQPGEKRRIYTIMPEAPQAAYRYHWQASGRPERTDADADADVHTDADVWAVPSDMDGWLIVGTDSVQLTAIGTCTYERAPDAPSGRTGSCDSVPRATYRQLVEQQQLVIPPGSEFRIRYDTRPGMVEILPAPAAMIGNTTELRYRAPRAPGTYLYTVDASWGRQAGTRSLVQVVVR